MGEAIMKEEKIDLIEKFKLYAIDKIEIKGESFDKEVKGKIFIVAEKSKVEKIINNIKFVNKSSLCDCRPRFKILFYNQEQIVLDLGFQNYENHYYLRYRNDEQFIPSKDLFDYLNNIVTN